MDSTQKIPKNIFSLSVKNVLIVIVIGACSALVIVMLALSAFHVAYKGRIFPGLNVAGINVGGLTPTDAALKIDQVHRQSPSMLTVNYLSQPIQLDPALLGIAVDPVACAVDAFAFGRSSNPIRWVAEQLLIFLPSIDIAPTYIFDQAIAVDYLQRIKAFYDQPMVDASISVDGTLVQTTTPQTGSSLEIPESLKAIQESIQSPFHNDVQLHVEILEPDRIEIEGAAASTQKFLQRDFVITTPNDHDRAAAQWTIAPETLAQMLTFEKNGDQETKVLTPKLREDWTMNLLLSIAQEIDRNPQNSRFIFNDDTRELDLLLSAKDGAAVDPHQSLLNIQQALQAGNSTAELKIDVLPPEVPDDAAALDLGITELVQAESSYFFGSDQARIQNIEKAANEFHGLLVPPGETFSMADAMGDITLDNGYAEALIIFNGKTIEGIGGGVCQVSTTLFRTAFFAGFPITERHPHAYRVSYYEKTASNQRDANLAGLDATVFIPLVDLKFINDTPHWLLMETYINKPANRLTWKFYSTRKNQEVLWTTTGPTNIIEPQEPIYQLNSDLSSGEIDQVDWEAKGAEITVIRTVIRDDSAHLEDRFYTKYEPWRAVYEYGPGTEGIPPKTDN